MQPGVVPARDLERTLKALKYSNVEARATFALAQAAGALGATVDPSLDGAPLRRLVATVGRLDLPALARLLWAHAAVAAEADEAAAAAAAEVAGVAGTTPAARRARRVRGIALYRRAMRIAWRDPLTLGDLAVDGDDLRAAGVGPGRVIGETLGRLLDVVIDDPTQNTRERLLAIAVLPPAGG